MADKKVEKARLHVIGLEGSSPDLFKSTSKMSVRDILLVVSRRQFLAFNGFLMLESSRRLRAQEKLRMRPPTSHDKLFILNLSPIHVRLM